MSWMHARSGLRLSRLASVLCISIGMIVGGAAQGSDGRRDFLEMNCVACHEGEAAEGGFDATALTADLDDSESTTAFIAMKCRRPTPGGAGRRGGRVYGSVGRLGPRA